MQDVALDPGNLEGALCQAALAVTLLQRRVDPADALEVLQDATAQLRLIHRATRGACWQTDADDHTSPPCVLQGEG